MSLDKIYSIATLGLQESEVRFIKITLGFTCHASTTRAQGRYEYTDNLEVADIVMVAAEDEESVKIWHDLVEKHPFKKLLLVTNTEQIPFTKFFFSRPFGPSKVLMHLDRIVKAHREYVPEVHIFSAAGKSAQREYFQSVQMDAITRHRALVIDDSPTVRKLLVLELGCFDIQVDTAESGELGLELLKENQYGIIFLDVVLPGANGYDVCKLIRKNQSTKQTPIVMLTSKSSPIDRVRGSLAGCNNYLTKPVDHENFFQVLEGYLAVAEDNSGLKKKFA